MRPVLPALWVLQVRRACLPTGQMAHLVLAGPLLREGSEPRER